MHTNVNIGHGTMVMIITDPQRTNVTHSLTQVLNKLSDAAVYCSATPSLPLTRAHTHSHAHTPPLPPAANNQETDRRDRLQAITDNKDRSNNCVLLLPHHHEREIIIICWLARWRTTIKKYAQKYKKGKKKHKSMVTFAREQERPHSL
jgi:hypothetical protein